MRKKFLLMILILSLFSSMGGGYLYGQTDVTTVTSETDLATALAAGGNVTLGASFEVDNTIEIKLGKTVTLDLNGYEISTKKEIYLIDNNGNLTINDGSENKSGGLVVGLGIRNGYEKTARSIAAKLTINGGTFKNIYPDNGAAVYNHGQLYIYGGNFYGQNVAISNDNAMAYIYGGYIDGYNYAITNTLLVEINDAQISGIIQTTGSSAATTISDAVTFYQARIGDAADWTSYKTFAEALTAASSMTGDVTIDILEKVTMNSSLSGSYSSINFVGKDTDSEIYLDVQGYITATGKNVAFENLTLSKSQGGFITNAGFMNVAFGVYDVLQVTYKNCVFANGAYAGSGVVTYTGCTFYRSHDKYGLWAYGDVEVTVNGGKFDDYRGIKMYAEGAAKTVDLTVKNVDFRAVTDKPAIVLTYGKSVTLEGNTYSSTGVFELDKDGAPNGTVVTADITDISCMNDNHTDCGVLVDGKIYTTIDDAKDVAKEGSTVTLFYEPETQVELSYGVTLNDNGYNADGDVVVRDYYTYAEFNEYVRSGNCTNLQDRKVVLKDSERSYYNNKTAQFFVGATDVNITDPVETVSVSNVTFEFLDDDNTNTYTSGELQVFAKNISFTECAFIGTAVSPWGVSNNENADTATFTKCNWKNLSGRYGVHQNRASNLTVTECTFTNCERGIHTNSSTPININITNNTFTGIGAGYGVLCLAENGNVGNATLNITGNTATGQTFLRQLNENATYEQISAILNTTNNTYGTAYVEGSKVPTAKIGDKTYYSLQKAIDAAVDGNTITLIKDVTEDVEITQKAELDLTIDGDRKKYTGVMTVFGNGRQSGAETLTIKNIDFVAANGASSCIVSPDRTVNNLYSYSHNVTVDNCTFTDSDGTVDCAAIRHEDGGDKNWTVTKCTVDATMHSLLQVNNVEGKLTLTECIVESKNGVNLNSCTNVEMTGCNFNVKGYALRSGVNQGGNPGVNKTYTLNNNTLKSACNDGDAVIMFRASTVDANLSMTKNVVSGTTHISGNTADTKISADANYWDGKTGPVVAEGSPQVVVNSYYKDEALTELVRIPLGDNFTAYTREDGIWGEVGGNAVESFVIKVLDAKGNVMGTTSLNNIDGIIDGSVYVTWSLKLDAASNNDSYWTMNWTKAPTIDNMPAKVELCVDGVKVGGGDVVLNAPDGLNKINAANIDAEGKILAYRQTLKDAVNNSDNVAILVAGTYNVPTGKDLTITGAVEGVKFDMSEAVGIHASMIFNNVTFEYGNANYKGLQHAGAMVYNNCTINGQVFLYGTSETFNKCIFNQNSADAYNVWTYGAEEVAFNECTFNSAGKSVLIYSEDKNLFNNVAVTKCIFAATSQVEGKAAIEMDSSLTAGINLTIDSEETPVEDRTTATGFDAGNVSRNSLWNNKKGASGDNNDITVTVAGEVVLQPEFEAQIGETKYEFLSEAIAAVGAGDVIIKLLDDATLDYDAREAYGTAETTSLTIKGNNETLTLNQTNSDWSSFGLANADAKVVFNNMTIEKTGYGDTSGAWNTHAIIFSSNVEMNNVTVNNSMAVQNGATLNNVTINEANGFYGLWINGNGQSVTMNGGAINATNGGRGIKIADEYVDDIKQVTLSVTGTEFNTAKKAAVLVSSTAGAKVTAEDCDITNVVADNTNFVWVDEEWAAYYNNVKVYEDATKTQENEESFPIKVYKTDINGTVRAYFKNLDELFAAKSTQIPLSDNYIELRGDVVANSKVNVGYSNNCYYNFGTSVENGVTMTFNYADKWNMLPHFGLGENITMNVPYLQVTGGDISIAGTLNTGYLYLYGTGEGVVIEETGVVNANVSNDKTVQVKGGTVLTVKGELNTSTLNVWTDDANNSELIVSGANAEVNASTNIHAWNGKDGVSSQKITVENGAKLTATSLQADRGSVININNATIVAPITLGYGDNVGTLVESGNSTVEGNININSTTSTVTSDGGLENSVSTNKEGYMVVLEDGVYRIAQIVAQIGETNYASLQDAVDAAENGAIIKLYKDITLDKTVHVRIGDVVTLDLNGKTVNYDPEVWVYGAANSGTALLTVDFGGELVIDDSSTEKTGTLDASYSAEGWGHDHYDVYSAVMMTARDDNAGNGTAKLTVNGGTLKGFFAAIAGNKDRDNTEITINGGYLKAAISEAYSTAGIEHPMNGKLTINGGTIEGMDGISFRSGTLEITGGTIIGNAPTNTIDDEGYWDNDFAACTGNAVQVISRQNSNPQYQNPTVKINGGHFISENSDPIASYAGYKGETPDVAASGFVYGGTFNKQIAAELCAPGFICTQNTDGTYGIVDDPVNEYISTLEDLEAFRDAVNGGTTYKNMTVYLAADIDLAEGQTRGTESKWTPIGNSDNNFQGTFDGQDHTISNLVIEGGTTSDQGFFGFTTNGEIKNLTINNAKVSGRLNVGVVAGTPYTSKYTNIKVTGHVEVNGMSYVGGVGGKNAYANWTNITVDVDESSYVKATSTENGTAYRAYVGGVIGFNGEGGHTFKNITSNINVIGDVCDIGGIFGILHYNNKVENVSCSATVESTGEADELGGIAGVWHNEKGTSVTMNDVEFTGTVKDVNGEVEGVDFVGGAYNANNETAENSGSLIIDGNEAWLKVAQVGEEKYLTLAAAAEAAQASKTITLLADVTEDVTLPAGITFNGNGKSVSGTITADGNLTFMGVTKVDGFSAGYYNHTINIGEGASLEVTTNRLTVSYGNVFNITGSIENAKTADKSNITPSLILTAGVSFNGDGGGVKFNVNNAYVVIGDATTKNSGATGEFNLNFDNSIVDFTKTLKTYEPTVSGLTPVVNINMTNNSVVSFASHLELWRSATALTLDNSNLTVGGSFANAGVVTVKNEANFVVNAPIMSSHGGNTGTIVADGGIFELKDSNQDWENAGTMKVTTTGKFITNDFKCVGEGKMIVDAATLENFATATVIDGNGVYNFEGVTTLENANGVTASYKDGDVTITRTYVAKIGDTYYATLAEAVTAAANDATIELIWAEGKAPIAMNASLYGKNVTITGTATVDWSKGWFYVGRGGTGNATLTFDGANLTSASNSASYGIHVSGSKKANADNTYYGTVIIKNSTIELDYLIDRGAIELNDATLTVKNGFGIAGRPASETEDNKPATATISLIKGAKLIVNNHNGMGVGQAAEDPEGYGIMNIDATSTFETTQSFNISANGTMNNNGGNITINGTLTVNGNLNSSGNITGNITKADEATIILTGGTYTQDVNAWCHADYDAIAMGDGKWIVVQVSGTQTRELPDAGWYWFSTYITYNNEETALDNLQAALGSNASLIKGQNAFTQYLNYNGTNFWTSDLTTLSTAKMYMIKTKADNVTVNLTGRFEDYANTNIELKQGWNWIGYPINEAVSLNDAIPTEALKDGDIIKDQTSSARYYVNFELPNGNTFTGWDGSLTEMKPGQGYMFKSVNEKTFSYTTSSNGARSTLNTVDYNGDNHWFTDATQYPNNMNIVAMMSIDGEIVKGNYEVAAFANGECRGSARPIYIEALDAYVLYMTIHGEDVAELTFKYYDVNYGTEYELDNRLTYSSDAILGSLKDPYIFTMNILGIGENSIDNINIYPNPTTTDREINLQAMCDKVEVFNALGVKVAEYTNVDSIDAIETAGIYVIRVTIDGNARNCRLVVR